MKKIILIVSMILLLFSCKEDVSISDQINNQMFDIPNPGYTQSNTEEEILRIMSFNIQVFGRSKMSKPEVVEILVDIIQQFDLIVIQEIRDASGEAILQLMDLLPERYALAISQREGRTSSKEQYAFIYDVYKLTLVEEFIYDDPGDIFERSPYAAYFMSVAGDFDFIIINNHISPGDAESEIRYMPEITQIIEQEMKELDIISVGDFNADGSYFDEENLKAVFPSYLYRQLIGNEINTTVARSENTYDRIMITNEMEEDWNGISGVYYFTDYYNFSLLSIEEKEVSDHYPVYAEFFINNDTD